jgi:ABC-type polysaccharide/polyol phosphate export permease
MKNNSKQKNFWEILAVLTKRHIQVKYQQTFFGFIWAIFMPIVIVMAGVFVRTGIRFISKGSIEITQVSSVAVKSLPWAFFIGALKFTVNSLVSNVGILKKIYFPRIIFPLSYILSSLFDFFVATVAFGIVLAFLHVGISVYILWAPVLMLILVCYTAGWGTLFRLPRKFFPAQSPLF